MREFFRGWKRKVGCVTLVIACVFAVAWVRSCLVRDWLYSYGGVNTEFELRTLSGGLKLARYEFNQPHGAQSRWISRRLDKLDPTTAESPSAFLLTSGTTVWRYQALGIECGRVKQEIDASTAWNYSRFGGDQPYIIEECLIYFPYWFLVIPLTMLSAWLLLSKPKRPTSTTAPPL